MHKQELRQFIRQQKRLLTPQQRDEQSLAIARKLLAHPRIERARTLLLYHPLPDEVDATSLLETPGVSILLPRVIDDCRMELRRYEGPESLQRGAFGIMEPCGALFSDYGRIDVAVVPGMAFDRNGHRLGRGRGYYDRLLVQLPQAYKIGICFDFQLMEAVEADAHDVLMDEIVSI